MPSVVRIEDDFEEHTFDPRVFASASANSSIIEKTNFFPVINEKKLDLIHFHSDGTLVALECKAIRNRPINAATPHLFSQALYICTLDLENIRGIHHRGFELRNQSAAVLYRSAVDEFFRTSGSHETGSASCVSRLQDDEDSSQAASTHPLTRVAYERLRDIPVRTREAINEILSKFLNAVESRHLPLPNLPPLRLKLLDDSSYLMEWTFEDRRLGFSFEEDPTESGWYFVYYNGSSERCESGTMDQLEMKRLINLMLRP